MTHLYSDPEATRAAQLEREQMPKHFFARDLEGWGKDCQYKHRPGGVRCEGKPGDPVHLPPAK